MYLYQKATSPKVSSSVSSVYGSFVLFAKGKSPTHLSKNESMLLSPRPVLSCILSMPTFDITIPVLRFLPIPYKSLSVHLPEPNQSISTIQLQNLRVGK